MICSFVLGLYPEKENKIYKYVNFDELKKVFLKEISSDELKKITVSNFLTKDKIFNKKTYYLKISSIDSNCTLKVLKLLFFYKITNHIISIKETNFKITNIYHNSFWAKQMDIDKFLQEKELKNKIEIKILTPMFFKVGNQYVCSIKPIYIFNSLIKKIKISSLYNEKILEYIKNFDINKIEAISEETSIKNIFKYKTEGITGKITFEIKNFTEEQLLFFNILLYFSFFSGIGYLTEKGYGQVINNL